MLMQVWRGAGRVQIDPERCKGCGLCLAACPRDLLYLDEQTNRYGQRPAAIREADQERCTLCRACALVCPDLAIALFRPAGEVSRRG